MDKQKTLFLIGNAHLDPVWLWRYPDGLAEIKATFRAALDRIRQYDEVIFTSACISYYRWVEENCPEMFEEIRQAVHAGRWCITGAQWVQPDCNIPSAESIARHYLYSQRYVREKFGVSVQTGYNVDSFGHNRALPKLLRAGGMKHYVYMRPFPGDEKAYPFTGNAFRWRCRGEEVLVWHIPERYNVDLAEEGVLAKWEAAAEKLPTDMLVFYGVGNHGGGPTVRQIEAVKAYRPQAGCRLEFSDPDRALEQIGRDHPDDLPVYEGDLQNHASGCYSAGTAIKEANRRAENQLAAAEKWGVLAAELTGAPLPDLADGWQTLLFQQFHDILCGCSIRAAYADALAGMGHALHLADTTANAARQRISWAVDTSRGVECLTRERFHTWEYEQLGAPFVVFNPLSYEVELPLRVRVHFGEFIGVTDENDNPLPLQKVRGDYPFGLQVVFPVKLPAYGYRTYWLFTDKPQPAALPDCLKVTPHSIENDKLILRLDPATGAFASLIRKDTGVDYLRGMTPTAWDDPYDTWAHGAFVFDRALGDFEAPQFRVLEDGPCLAELEVTQTHGGDRVRQILSLAPGEEAVSVRCEVFMTTPRKLVRLTARPAFGVSDATYEAPGDFVRKVPDGREQPMQRYVAVTDGKRGLAIATNGRHSASATAESLSVIAVRTCYYADHNGANDDRAFVQDLGETSFRYVLIPFEGDTAANLTAISHWADRCQTEFAVVPETYHTGPLPQVYSALQAPANAAVTAVKPAEDGDGLILRVCETAERPLDGELTLFGRTYPLRLKPMEVATFRCSGERWEPQNLLEDPLA